MIAKASISRTKVRTKSATVSSELALDPIARLQDPDKHTSEGFQTKIRIFIDAARRSATSTCPSNALAKQSLANCSAIPIVS